MSFDWLPNKSRVFMDFIMGHPQRSKMIPYIWPLELPPPASKPKHLWFLITNVIIEKVKGGMWGGQVKHVPKLVDNRGAWRWLVYLGRSIEAPLVCQDVDLAIGWRRREKELC